MATVTFAQFVDDVIVDYSLLANNRNIQNFNVREVPYGGVLLARELNRTQGLLPRPYIEQLGGTVDTPVAGQQTVKLNNIYGRKAVSSNTTMQRIDSSAAQQVYEDTLNFFDFIGNEGFTYSQIANFIRQSNGTEGFLEKANERVYDAAKSHAAMLLKAAINNIYKRLNTQIENYIVASRWQVFTSPDNSTIYLPVAGEYKQIPIADAPTSSTATLSVFMHKLMIEKDLNAFGENGMPILYYTPRASLGFGRMDAFGANNAFNDGVFRNQAGFDLIQSMTLTDANPADAGGTIYMIDGGSTVMYQREPLALYKSLGMRDENMIGYTAGNDTWAKPLIVGEGTNIFPQYPTLILARHIYEGWNDSSVDYPNTDYSQIDRVSSVTFGFRGGMHTAKNLASPAETSILGYRVF